MVGIAYGLKGNYGDILIADTVREIDPQNVTTEPASGAALYHPRGERVAIASELLAPFKRAARGWPQHEQRAGRPPVAALTDEHQPRPLQFVVGASGNGKSSFVQAWLLPALEQHYLARG